MTSQFQKLIENPEEIHLRKKWLQSSFLRHVIMASNNTLVMS